jgi:hypothetical protein
VNQGEQATYDKESGLIIQLHDNNTSDHLTPSVNAHSLMLGTYTTMWMRKVCACA